MSAVRKAAAEDAEDIGRLLDQFNREYDDPTPGADEVASRAAELLQAEEITVLLVGDGPDGIAVMRFRPSLWGSNPEAYLEELYVIPKRRGEGFGRALLSAVIELSRERSASYIGLGTSTDDSAALSLYESAGFRNLERPGGPSMLWYELELEL
jgi:ribosomal protein S18 acetylase RimI-like enzyme